LRLITPLPASVMSWVLLNHS